MGNHEKINIMNWIILVIIGKYFNWYYLSSGEQTGRNKLKEIKLKKKVGKQNKNCESQVKQKIAYYCKQQ